MAFTKRQDCHLNLQDKWVCDSRWPLTSGMLLVTVENTALTMQIGGKAEGPGVLDRASRSLGDISSMQSTVSS